MRIKFTYDEVKDFIESRGYKLISKKYENNNQQLVFCDNDGYVLSQRFVSFKNKNAKPMKFHKSNPYTIQNIKLWCKLNNKSFELLSDNYENNIKKLKWKCFKETCGEIFEASWRHVSQGEGCGICNGKQVVLSNCLATKNPELAKEWHPTKNGDLLTPYNVTSNSNKKVWWLCSKNTNHEWKVSINNRSSGNGCPYCSGHLPSEDYNLLVVNPKLCEDWDCEKNDKRPEEYTPNANKKVWWKCKECGYEWKVSINLRNRGNGCSQCSQKIKKTTESFKEEIKKLYNNEYEFIGEYINVNTISVFKHKICGNYFKCSPSSFLNGADCPYCTVSNYKNTDIFKYQINKIIENEYEVCGEYISAKTKILMKHNECGKYFLMSPTNFLSGQRCNVCNQSKGEEKINQILINNNFINIAQHEYDKLNNTQNINNYYIPQKEFNGLVGLSNGNLSYDFYLPNYNLLIEYQGIQHEKPIDFKGLGEEWAIQQFERQQEHDHRKREYAKNNNINLLEIWYYDFDNIEKILNNNINMFVLEEVV